MAALESDEDEWEDYDEETERSLNQVMYLPRRDPRESSSEAHRRDLGASSSEHSRGNRAERYESAEEPTSSSFSSSASSSTLSATERMRRATEERERGRAVSIAEREERERSRGTAPEPRHARSLKPHSRMTYEEAHEIAIQLEPKDKKISKFITFKAFKRMIDIVLTRTKNNPIAVADMKKVEKKFKVGQIIFILFKDEIEKLNEMARKLSIQKPSNPIEKRRLEDEKHEIQLLLERLNSHLMTANLEVTEAATLVRKISESPTIPSKWMEFEPVELVLPNIETDCLGETKSAINHEELIQGKCVKLSDGRCYNFDDAIDFYEYNNGLNMVFPYSREPVGENDIAIMKTLIAQREHGRGGKRTRNKRTHRNKMRKTRVR